MRVLTRRVARTASYVLLAALLCFLVLGAARAWFTAQAAGENGLLALLQPEHDNTPATMLFYSANGELVHELPLPQGVELSADAISPDAISPDGRHWVYLSGAVSSPEAIGQSAPLQEDLTLHILRTTDGVEISAIPLLPIDFPNNIGHNAVALVARDPSLGDASQLAEAVWAAFSHSLGIYAWSPDGKLLAFSAATDGPSSDLYLFDTTTQRVTRLTDGIEQMDGIRWSPDGRWIWHSTISYGYCQACDGHHYAAAADGSSVINLPGSDIYRFLAWTDDTGASYLVTDQANGPGSFALQRVDIATGSSEMLWAGVHAAYLYDVEMSRLGILGSRGQSYDPDEQVFAINLATGEETEYDDLASALEEEPWLAPLDQYPVTYRCDRSGPLVYPCLETPFDPISPNGSYYVTDYYSVEEIGSGEMLLPYGGEISPGGQVLWRPDSAGFYVFQDDIVLYRAFDTGAWTQLKAGRLLGWLPHAHANSFATLAQPSINPPPAAPPAAPPTTPTVAPTATPAATAVIDVPYRTNVLDGSFSETSTRLRMAQARELTAISHAFSTDATLANTASVQQAREQGLHLLLAHEAVSTYLEPPFPHPAENAPPDVALEAELAAALDAALAVSPPLVTTYPNGGDLSNSYSVAVSPDGSMVANGNDQGSIFIWDYESGHLLRVLQSAGNSIRLLQFSSDSKMLAATDQGNEVQMWHVDTGMKSTRHIGQHYYTYAVAWRPNTYDLAVANGSDTVMIHPRNSAAFALIDPSLNLSAETLTYSPDGSQLAVALHPRAPTPEELAAQQAVSPQERPIWIVDADSGELLHEIPDDRTTYFLAYTPDGSTLVIGSGYRLRAWDITSGTLRFESELPDFPNGWAMTPDGSRLAILSRRAGISFFDLANGEHVRDMPVDADVLAWLAVHPTENQLVSSDINGRPILLDMADGTPEFRFGVPRARLAATSPSAPILATADRSLITLYNLDTHAPVRELLGAGGHLTDIAFSRDGQWLAAREEAGYLALWHVDEGSLQWRVDVKGEAEDSEWGVNIAFAPDGNILTGGSDGVLRLFDQADGRLLGEVAVNAQIMSMAISSRNEAALVIGGPNGIAVRVTLDGLAEGNRNIQTVAQAATIRSQPAYSPDGSLLAIIRSTGTGYDAALEFLDTATGEVVQTIAMGDLYTVNATAFSPDGTLFATGAYESHPITLWDVASGAAVQSFGMAGPTQSTMQISRRLAFSADGTQLLATDNRAVTTQYSLLPTHVLRSIAAHNGSVWDVAVRPNSRWAATAGDDHRVRVWDWQTGAQLYHSIEEPERIATIRFSPSGDTMITGSFDGSVRLYDAGGGLQQALEAHTDVIIEAIFAPDGTAFATASQDGSVASWNRSRALQSWRVEDLPMGVGALAYSPDSTQLAGSAGAGTEATITVWDAANGEALMQLRGHSSYVIGLAFSPDGTLLASASWDQTIKLWDTGTGEEVATLQGHEDILTGLAFSPDGALLASVAEDYTLRLWDVATQQEIRTIQMPRTLPWAVSFSSRGHALLTTHADGTLRTWLARLDDDSLQAKQIAVAGRVPRITAEFTARERSQYAIDSFIGSYPLSASANVNLGDTPYVKSLIVQPGASDRESETLFALTNDKFLLASSDAGERWRIVARLPLTLTYHSLGIPARFDDPLLIATDQGLYRVGDDGALILVHSDALIGVSYSHTNADELWAVRTEKIYKSEDAGSTWGEASADLNTTRAYAPLLNATPNNNPQFVASTALYYPALVVWRGTGNGFWQELENLPAITHSPDRGQGIAWDAAARILYLSDTKGLLYAVENADAPDHADITALIVEHFGPGTRPIPLAVGKGQTLYLDVTTSYGHRFVRGVWDGARWNWAELRIPLVAAG